MIDPERTYDAIARLRRLGERATVQTIDQELNEACGLTGEPEVHVRKSLGVLKSRGQVEEVDGELRLRLVEETGERLLF